MGKENLINIIEKAKSGDEESFEILFFRYKKYIDKTSFTRFIKGSGIDDVIQHGYIGLWRGIKYFNKDKVTNIDLFMKLCIKREIYNAIKTADRKKHRAFNCACSIETEIYEKSTSNLKLKDVVLVTSENLEEEIIGKELEKLIYREINKLPKMQMECMRLYIDGFKQAEICKILSLKSKQVDNALTRAKTNLKIYLEAY